jgi:surfactin family lipopeptide synthetase A
MSQAFADPGYFNQSILLDLANGTDISLLEGAFNLLIPHHDGLRKKYNPSTNATFYNGQHHGTSFKLKICRLADDPNALIDCCEPLKSGFDITKDLLIRAAVLITNDSCQLFITAHHLIVDAFSWRIILEDLNKIYKSLSTGKIPMMREKTASLLDWQNVLVAMSDSMRESDYWSKAESWDFRFSPDVIAGKGKHVGWKSVTGQLDREKTENPH